MTQEEMITMAMAFRIGERIALSIIIVVIACIVMIAFWRSVQQIEMMTSGEKFGGAGTIVLSTPIFILLALIAYAYISFANPVAFNFSKTINGHEVDKSPTAETSSASFTGFSNDGSSTAGKAQVDNTEFVRARAIDMVRSLNCTAGDLSKFSTKVLDDFNRVKLKLLEPSWPDGWGSYDAFAERVMGRIADTPDPKVLEIFQSKHEICTDLSR